MRSLANFVKQAIIPHRAVISPEHSRFNEGLKAEALRKLLRLGLYSGGAGMGLGVLVHLLGGKNVQIPSAEADDPDIDLPYPQIKTAVDPYTAGSLLLTPSLGAGIGAAYGAVRHPRDQTAGALYGATQGLGQGLGAGTGTILGRAGGRALQEWLAKTKGGSTLAGQIIGGLLGGAAGDRLGAIGTRALLQGTIGPAPWAPLSSRIKQGDWADATVKAVMPTPAGQSVPRTWTPRWLRGDSQYDRASMPWVIPASLGVGIGGLFGGHALVRHLLKRHRKSQLDEEVAAAKKEYEEAMMGQYDPKRIHKLASAPRNRLQDIYQQLEKLGGILNWSADPLLGKGTGAYLTLATLLAGLTGMGTYHYLKGRRTSKLLEDALKQRALMRGLTNPPDVYLHPVPAYPQDDSLAGAAGMDPLAKRAV